MNRDIFVGIAPCFAPSPLGTAVSDSFSHSSNRLDSDVVTAGESVPVVDIDMMQRSRVQPAFTAVLTGRRSLDSPIKLSIRRILNGE